MFSGATRLGESVGPRKRTKPLLLVRGRGTLFGRHMAPAGRSGSLLPTQDRDTGECEEDQQNSQSSCVEHRNADDRLAS